MPMARTHADRVVSRHKAGQEITSAAFDHYDMTIAMLNKTMGIRLR